MAHAYRFNWEAQRCIFIVGRVLGADDHISFHGATLAELTAAFQAAVDDYLADCRERGTPPLPPATSGP